MRNKRSVLPSNLGLLISSKDLSSWPDEDSQDLHHADSEFEGDRTAFEIKASRQAESELLKVKFDRKKGHYRSLEIVEALLGNDDD